MILIKILNKDNLFVNHNSLKNKKKAKFCRKMKC